MKRNLPLFAIVLSLIIIASSCTKAPFLTLNTPNTISFTNQGGTQSISFTANRAWSVSSSDSWCKVSPSSGEAMDGIISVTITCDPNTTYDPRNATLTVRAEELSETISVTQETNLGLLVSPTSFNLTNAAQTIEVEVRANVNYAIEIDAACKDWITQTRTKALSSDKLSFAIAANESYDNREGRITIKQTDGNLSETILVKQSQTNGLFITTPEYDLSNDAHTLSVEVKANVEFAVTPQVDWIKYVETRALSSSSIVLSIEANETYDNRTGTVLIKQSNGDLSGTITISQKQTDGLFVTPTDVSITKDEQTVELVVKNNVSFNVVIPDDAKEWISVKSNTATRALADDRIVLAIAQNDTYDDREASVTIKQTDGPLAETVIIKQAQTNVIIVSNKEYLVSVNQQSLSIDIQTNVDVSVKPNVDWIHHIQTRALNNNTVELSIDANETYENRTGVVILQGNGGDVSEAVSITQKGLVKKEVVLQSSGTLKSLLGTTYTEINHLIVHGDINGSDIRTIREIPDLRILDISDTRIVSGGDTYYDTNRTSDNVIGTYMFYERAYEQLFLPNNIIKIDTRGFYKYAGKDFNIPDSVVEIGDNAFTECSRLTTVKIPNSVKTLGEYAFSSSPAIKRVEYGRGLSSTGRGTFAGCSSLSEIILPDNIVTIGYGSFNRCYALEYVTLPPKLKEIEEDGFRCCSSLKEIVIPDSVTRIGDQAFNCYDVTSSLAKVKLGENVEYLGIGSFYRSVNLEEIEIPAKVTTIGGDCFGNCRKLSSIKMKSLTPPKATEYNGRIHIYGIASNAVIYVPNESLSRYKEAEYWRSLASMMVGY